MSTIAAGTTLTTALVETGDTTGNLVIQTNGTTTAATFDTSQNLTVVNNVTATRVSVGIGSNTAPSITFTGDTNTGIYSPAADTIAFTEGGAESMRIDSSGNLQFNSGYGSVATAYGCRAWVNFNGTSTVAIRASGNVTSITDNGTGDYTVNFTTAMPDANYSVVKSDNYFSVGDIKVFNTNNVTVRVYQNFSTTVDTSIVCVSIFR